MAAKRLNVLVYSGSGSTLESVKHCLYSLRRLLSPNYAVLPITGETINKEPWQATCALIVLPGGADLGYCRVLNGDGNRRIRQYVHTGGSYLGFCAGGYYGSARCEFEVGNADMEVVGPRELEFFPGSCRGSAFAGFVYNSEGGARAARMGVDKAPFMSVADTVPETFRAYVNGGGVFVDAESYADRGVEVLASYIDKLDIDPGQSAAAVIFRKVGDGRVVLTGSHPEFAAVNLSKTARGMKPSVVDALAEDDDQRGKFLKACLMKLGMEVNEQDQDPPSLSVIHLSSINGNVSTILEAWETEAILSNGESYIHGEQDIFHLQKTSSSWSMAQLAQNIPDIFPSSPASEAKSDDGSKSGFLEHGRIVKRIVPHMQPLSSKETPFFNHMAYFASLKAYYSYDTSSEAPGIGSQLLYGEVVTSTSTLLEKNPKLTTSLPNGTTFTATTQVAGRGRGSNVWISPAGSLMFSTLLRHPLAINVTAPVVFLQYLAALAIAEGVQTYDTVGVDPMLLTSLPSSSAGNTSRSYRAMPVRLKWPNDIYALSPTSDALADPTSPNAYTKIGGILVNTSYSGGDYTLIMGIGLNVSNAAPTTSLNALVSSLNASLPASAQLQPFTLEKLLARILCTFSALYEHFCQHGFSGRLEELYYRHWLHAGQIVTLEEERGVKARIKGITSDWGLLRAEEVRETGAGEWRSVGREFALQSDSNSFDFFKGLVRRKI